MTEELIKVPDIGGAEGAEVVEVLVAPGDTIEVEQSLIVVESDKASARRGRDYASDPLLVTPRLSPASVASG